MSQPLDKDALARAQRRDDRRHWMSRAIWDVQFGIEPLIPLGGFCGMFVGMLAGVGFPALLGLTMLGLAIGIGAAFHKSASLINRALEETGRAIEDDVSELRAKSRQHALQTQITPQEYALLQERLQERLRERAPSHANMVTADRQTAPSGEPTR